MRYLLTINLIMKDWHWSNLLLNFVCAFQGLNILANTCNGKTVDLYTKFTDHVASEALANEDTVAVVNRRYTVIGYRDKGIY